MLNLNIAQTEKVLENATEDELQTLLWNYLPEDESVLEMDEFLEDAMSDGVDTVKDFIDTAQNVDNINVYDRYIYTSTYYKDCCTADTIHDLFNTEKWMEIFNTMEDMEELQFNMQQKGNDVVMDKWKVVRIRSRTM